MYFSTKSYLKSTRNHTAKHALKLKSRFAIREFCDKLKFHDKQSYTWKEFFSQVLLDNGCIFL
jgi:hypothetical protein